MNQKPEIAPSVHEPDEKSALDHLKISRIILPALIGLGVVGYLMSRQLDLGELRKLDSNFHTLFWVSMALLMYVIRHIFFTIRLMINSDFAFSWRKSLQLIVLWEFSTCVSPTSVGGAGVALYLLTKEKISAAKTITIVVYSMVMDTVFLGSALLILYLIIGPVMIRPGMNSIADIDGYGMTFLTVLCFMLIYGSIFFYGLFVNPNAIKRLILIISKISFLQKFRHSLEQTADDVIIAAQELKKKPFIFFLQTFACTAGAWTVRFLAINCLIIAFVSDFRSSLADHFIILSRGMAMHIIEAFSPTPGAAGVAEFLFGGFFSDYIPIGLAALIALIWRLFGYYSYLIAGALVIPVWLRRIKSEKK